MQPPDFELIDWQNPLDDDDLNRRLAGLWLPGACNSFGGLYLYDISGRGAHATHTNGAAARGDSPYGCMGSTLYSIASSQYSAVGSQSHLMHQGTMSIFAWFRNGSDTTSNQSFASTCNSGGNRSNYVFVYAFGSGANESKLSFWNNADGPEVYSNTAITDGKWHFVGATRSGSSSNWTITYYLDGKQDGSGSATANPNGDGSETLSIGRLGSFNGYYMGGHIGPVWIYTDRVFSSSEVAGLYRSSLDCMSMLRRHGSHPYFVPAAPGGAAVGRGLLCSTKLYRRSLVG